MIDPKFDHINFPYCAPFSAVFDSRGVMRGASPECKGAREWCFETLSENDYTFGWTGFEKYDRFVFRFRYKQDLIAFKLRFRV